MSSSEVALMQVDPDQPVPSSTDTGKSRSRAGSPLLEIPAADKPGAPPAETSSYARRKATSDGRFGPVTNVLVWLREVDDRARADPGERPSTQQINLVAMHRVLFADPDGRNCYPAQTTLANKCGLDRKTVRAVDGWLIDNKLMAFERNRSHGQKEYRLESDGGGEHHLEGVDKSSDGGADTQPEPETDGGAEHHLESDGCPDGAQMGVPTPTTFHLLPVEKGFTDDPTGRASPADHEAWEQAHPEVQLAEQIA